MYQFLSRPDLYAGLCGRLNPRVARRSISGAPDFLRGLKLLFISDVHCARRTTPADLARLTRLAASLAPDLILLGGDYADRAEHAARFFRAWKGLEPPLGCYGAVGNNDREAWPDLGKLEQLMSDAGCSPLVNRSVKLEINGGALWIAGIDDLLYGSPRVDGLYPPDSAPDRYRILIYHEPCPVRPAPDLMLSGHTHGGQFNLLGITPYSIGFERLYGRRISPLAIAGLHDVGGGRLLVSKGIGGSRIPLRIGVRPEIDMIAFE